MLPNTLINTRLMKDHNFKDKMNHYLLIFMIFIIYVIRFILGNLIIIRQIQSYQVKTTLVSKRIYIIIIN